MLTFKLDDIPAEGLNFTWTEERSSLLAYLENFSHIDFDFETPLQSEVRVWRTGRSVLMRGKVKTTLRMRCVRCLKEFPFPISSTFDLTLYPLKETSFAEDLELSKNDMESGFYEGGEIHLSEIACEQIFLEIPYQSLCHEECKGLCSKCGKDLNLTSCDCEREEFVSSFSALKKLKLD
jgi:uncharacterized protein